MPGSHSDVLILGGGPGGYACALRAAQLGLSVTIVEAEKLGGTCLHRGCVPAKAILHTAEIVENVRAGAAFGVLSQFSGVDVAALHEYKNSVIDRLYTGLTGLVGGHGIEVVSGHGRLVDAHTIEVAGTHLTGTAVVLATGSRARSIPGIPLGSRVITSDEALNLDFVPGTAVVLGGGVIGIEFASAWASMGAQVTVVEALPRILATEDPWCSEQLTRAFRRRGITILTAAELAEAKPADTGVTVDLADGRSIAADLLLVAVGRAPRTDGIGLEDNGIELDRGFVVTDPHQRTSVDGVYAVGDIVPGPQLAHRGFQHGIVTAETIAGLTPTPTADHLVPRVTYSHPEVASVGLTEAAAHERYGAATTVTYDLAGNAKSQILRTTGGIKVVRAGGPDQDGPVVGVHMVGDRVGELIGEAQLTVGWEALASDVAPFLHAHPSQHEALGEAMLALAGTPLHTH
ncbi:dihydrolipoamide dehydrogenase [Nocardia sp. GAS34]|uniref:dihydrolipoyl dehydrogenase n=1 Tax=unclassified Nocardia TaxID=2637762 RepID=UPI003D24559A